MLAEMIEKCRQCGCDESRAYAAHRLFQDLIENYKYWDVGWHCMNNILYCTGRSSRDSEVKIFIPVPISSVNGIQLRSISALQENFNASQIVLCIQSTDSSSVLYEANRGLVKKSPEVVQKAVPESFIRNNKKLLLSFAQGSKKWEDKVLCLK